MYNPQNLACNIKKFRKIRNLTQGQLAEKLYVTPQNISKWENGISSPDIEKLCEIARIFSISTDLLLGINDDVTQLLMLAIDGGGTKTEFLLFSMSGEIVENFTLTGTNPNSVGMENCLCILKQGITECFKEI